MRGEAGFTLVELLVALVAGSLLLASLGWMTGMLGTEVSHSGDQRQFAQLADVAPMLTHLLETARPMSGASSIEADEDHLTAQVDPPLAKASQGPMRLDLAVEQDRDGEALALRLASMSDDQSSPKEERRLVHGFKEIDIGVTDGEGENAPPRLITINFKGADGSAWELAAEPRLYSTGGCRFDPISMTCRP